VTLESSHFLLGPCQWHVILQIRGNNCKLWKYRAPRSKIGRPTSVHIWLKGESVNCIRNPLPQLDTHTHTHTHARTVRILPGLHAERMLTADSRGRLWYRTKVSWCFASTLTYSNSGKSSTQIRLDQTQFSDPRLRRKNLTAQPLLTRTCKQIWMQLRVFLSQY